MKRSSRTVRIGSAAAVLCLSFVCLAGCQGSASSIDPATEDMVETALTSAGVDAKDVAAVVGGRIITQDEVDAAVEADRARNGNEDDADWAEYLRSSGMTEWDVRAATIKGMVDDVLVAIEAERLGIDVESEVDQRMQSLESLYPSHYAFVEAMVSKGFDETSYAQAVRRSLLWSALRDEVVTAPQPTDEQVRQYAVVVAPTLVGRRSSHILFSSDDYATAVRVLDEIESGADFAQLAAEYSIDSTADAGGDAGWDSLNTFTAAYQNALDKLEPGEVSGIVRTGFGYHIIMCTDKYDAPLDADGNIDIDAIPDDLMDAIVQSMGQSLTTQLFDLYIANLEATVPIAVFDADGVQVTPADVGLSVEETTVSDEDVDEALATVQETVQNAVEHGTQAIKLSLGTLLEQEMH